jgi:hypothetical protein
LSRLESLQADFAAALNDALSGPRITQDFSGDKEMVLRRLALYRGNVQANAVKALAATYPAIAKIVGDEFFAALCRAYVRATPSTGGDLNQRGAGFAAFVAGFEHARDLPYLADMARLEWLLHSAHFAADASALDAAALASVPVESQGDLRFALHPAAAWLASEHPLARIWQVNQDGFTGDMTVEAAPYRQYLLVSRPAYRAEVAVIGAGSFAFLQALADAQRLTDAFSAALAAEPAFDLAATLAKLHATGVLTAFEQAAGGAAD